MKQKARGTWVTIAVLWSAAACASHNDVQAAAGGASGDTGASSAGTTSVAGSVAHGGAGGGAGLPLAEAGLTADVGQP
ncbi:MAG TPA: hypothetical protein VNW92_15750, partial [Polyangiaceae bacterium]|nr:hypothetical protein [Polyangiaceae bacterium]